LLDEWGEKGFAIIAIKEDEHRHFYLEARPFERDFKEKMNERERDLLYSAGNYSPSMLLPLLFCPYCGANLEEAIQNNLTAFDKLASEVGAAHPDLRRYRLPPG